jgi:hypothetical protein
MRTATNEVTRMSVLRRAVMTGLVTLALAVPTGTAWADTPDDGTDGKVAGPADRTLLDCPFGLDPAERAELRSEYRALMDEWRADGRAVTDEWQAERRAAMDEWRAQWRALVDAAGDLTPEELAELQAARDELRVEHQAEMDELRENRQTEMGAMHTERQAEMQALRDERRAQRGDRP